MPEPSDERDFDLELHRRLVAGDPTASADLFTRFLDRLCEHLVKRNPRIPDFHDEAAADALISLVRNPNSFNSEHGKSLYSYLCMSAQCDLKNILRRERKHVEGRKPIESVELGPEAGNLRIVDPADVIAMREQTAIDEALVASVRAGLDERDVRALDLLLAGERSTPAFAQVLGIKSKSKEEQEDEVKRVKDKLKARLKRQGRNP